MGKDDTTPVSEQCTEIETTFIPGQQVIPKNSGLLGNVVSVRGSLSPLLCEGLTLPFPTKRHVKLQSCSFFQYNLATGRKNDDFLKQPPVLLSLDQTKMAAFSDNSVFFVKATQQLNRSVVVPPSDDDLPNETASSLEHEAVLCSVWEEERKIFLPFLQFLAQMFLAGGEDHVRKCPGGRNGSGGGAMGGATSGYANSSTMQQWVIGTGYGGSHSAGMPGGGAGDEDDDPWKQFRQLNPTPGHYLEQPEQFEAYTDLDKLTADILRDGDLFRELGLDELPDLPPLPDHPCSVRHQDYSDPAPMTPVGPPPMTPVGPPMTPSGPPMTPGGPPMQAMRSPVPVVSANNGDVGSLLEIHTLLMKPPASPQLSVPQQITSQDFSVSSGTAIGTTVAPTCTPRPPTAPVVGRQIPNSPADFFVITEQHDSTQHVIRMSVKNSRDNQAYQALEFCWNMHRKYEKVFEQNCTLPISVQNKAKLCTMRMDMMGGCTFSMPADCVPLAEWTERTQDLYSRHLVLQQIVNSLVVLFQGENDLSFWGSFKVFVARNLQVYLYCDFNKSLSVQKVYATRSGHGNPRLEDCQLLKDVFAALLQPFLNSWISPQLKSILLTFEQLVGNPSTCIHQITNVARVLGERRICKMHVQFFGSTDQYTVYSVEHEPVSSSLSILRNTVLQSSSTCIVYHVDGTFVQMTEISVRNGQNQYVLVMQDCSAPRLPGALYIE